MYVLDTDALVNLKNAYNPSDPDDAWFWDYMLELGSEGVIKIPEMVCEEVGKGHDALVTWLAEHEKVFILKTETIMGNEFGQVVKAYESLCPNYEITENDVEFLGSKADAYLIAHALKEGGFLVSREVHRNSTVIKNIKIPNVCDVLGIVCKPFARFVWELAERKLV